MAGYEPRVIQPASVTSGSDGGGSNQVVLTLKGVTTPGPGATVLLHGVVSGIASSGSGIQAQLWIVRGDTSGGHQLTGDVNVNVVAGQEWSLPFLFEDEPGDVASLDYSLVLWMENATAAGSITYASVGGLVS